LVFIQSIGRKTAPVGMTKSSVLQLWAYETTPPWLR
jgi:hypothetical protein